MSLVCPARRQLVLGLSGVAVASMFSNPVQASRSTQGVRELSFYNRHTGERQKGQFWAEGEYDQDTLSLFSEVLRDHRQNQSAPMDKRLYEFVYQLQQALGNTDEVHVISGYRSPKTNNMLAAKSNGVAKKSYHMKGMAMDLAIPGVELKSLRDAAKSLKLGGVGYYPRSGFIHVDCGPVRSW
ncbi:MULTISPECIES: DUF882 domain-containing protein [Shewanella]|uniref:Murein endopeptidase K n=1 Tax=Shewanella japonica TaxID=93973 RepID=A0ABN4YFA1_9GAMM|nr:MULTISPECIES: DUF882 domain-containing protein [Shewanella]ARD22941.1 hypothetical protein SJ2017_2654 [Shewanella japonica]KPZ70551.1 Peptidase M15 [Shewanella sp. P1-14-1]MBQ4891748.1 DUF882 domain-containing protein [Shewanella sp. MMG014]OBT09613.1 hypothetical protein A9267_20530 [Shewanella sp. UCD-FRSSP16_17]